MHQAKLAGVRFNLSLSGLTVIGHLRLKRLWLGIGALLIGGVAAASVVAVPTPVQAFMLDDKLTHLVVYAGLMGWFAQIFRHDLTRLLFAALFTGMGVAMEFLQAMTPSRQFDILDMVANTSGVVLAWALAYTWVGNLLVKFESRFLSPASRS